MILETKNLILDNRPLKYLDTLYELMREDNNWLSTWTLIPHPVKKKGVRKYYYDELRCKNNLFVILNREKDVMGMISLHKNPQHNSATIGYWLGLDYRNKGYMTEATQKVIEYGFMNLKLMRIEICAAEQNAPSLSVINKNGFYFEGVRRMGARNGFGHYADLKVYSILREEYIKNKKIK